MCTHPEIPTEVWIEIIEKHVSRATDRSSLSLTNRYLRGLTIPSIFRRQAFTRYQNSHTTRAGGNVRNSYTELDGALASSVRTTHRVEFLLSRPQLRSYVREVAIHGWSAPPESPWPTEIEEIQRVIDNAYSAVITLLPTLLRLEKLDIDWSPVTSKLHSLLPQLPLIHSILIRESVSGIQDSHTVISRGFRTLKEFTFLHNSGFNDGAAVVPYFLQLIASLSAPLTRLTVPYWCISHIISSVNVDLTSLLYLQVNMRTDIRRMRLVEMTPVYRVLAQSRDLRGLTVSAFWGTNQAPGRVPVDVIPKLEFLAGPPDVVCTVVPGRPICWVEVIHNSLSTTSFDLFALKESTVAITTLALHTGSISEDNIRHCGHVLPRLRRLTINIWVPPLQKTTALLGGILDTLPLWTELEICHLDADSLDLDGRITTETELKCPLAERDNPIDRAVLPGIGPILEDGRAAKRGTV
ncbi:hypothetical protein K439DRAFT_1617254 [Ramaria rubella]|nr:hypothetical protein K439DRAFT_1617254 [Ramaria rubella]